MWEALAFGTGIGLRLLWIGNVVGLCTNIAVARCNELVRFWYLWRWFGDMSNWMYILTPRILKIILIWAAIWVNSSISLPNLGAQTRAKIRFYLMNLDYKDLPVINISEMQDLWLPNGNLSVQFGDATSACKRNEWRRLAWVQGVLHKNYTISALIKMRSGSSLNCSIYNTCV